MSELSYTTRTAQLTNERQPMSDQTDNTVSSKPAQIHYLAIGGGPDHYDLLGANAVQHWKSIEQEITRQWIAGDTIARIRINAISGCLTKLSSTLIQVRRMQEHYNGLIMQAQNPSWIGSGLALRGDQACADFENLIFQGRSMLDRLTWCTTAMFKQQSHSYSKLHTFLNRLAKKSVPKAAEIVDQLEQANGWLSGVFARFDNPTSLRDHFSHKASAIESVSTCFNLVVVPSKRVLFLDCLIDLPRTGKAIGVLKTSREAVDHLACLVLNVVAILLGLPALPKEEFIATWDVKAIVVSEFEGPAGEPIGPHAITICSSMNPDGMDVRTFNVHPSIYERSIALT